MIRIAKELFRVALSVLTERDDLERAMKEAIAKGESVRFEYTKQDGTKKMRELMPASVFRMSGRMAVKGYEIDDPAKREKVFYLDMIGDVQPKHEETVGVQEELIRIPSGYHVLEDDSLARSADVLVRRGGVWASVRQGNFFYSMLARGRGDPNGFIARWVKMPDVVGVVMSTLRDGGSGFKNRDVFVIDEEGVKEKYTYWMKTFYTTSGPVDEKAEQRWEDIMDDFGHDRSKIPSELLKYETVGDMRDSSKVKQGMKLKWSRR